MRIPKLDELGKVSAQLLLNHQTLERSMGSLQRRIDALHRELEGVEALLGRVSDPSRVARDSLEQVLTQLGQLARTWLGTRRDARKEIAQARDRLFQSGIAQDELQARLRNLRLQPIAVLFERFPRAVRDLAMAQAQYPGWAERLLTHPVQGLDSYRELIDTLTSGTNVIKAFCEIAPLDTPLEHGHVRTSVDDYL